MATPVIVKGVEYAAYDANLTDRETLTFQCEAEGLIDAGRGDPVTLDGNAYTLSGVIWRPDQGVTQLRGELAVDHAAAIAALVDGMGGQVLRWVTDPVVARLTRLAGGTPEYAETLKADIGANRELRTVAAKLRRRGWSLTFTRGAISISPVWGVSGAAVAVTPTAPTQYDSVGSLPAGIPAGSVAAAEFAEAKAAAQAVANELAAILQLHIDVLTGIRDYIFRTGSVWSALALTRRTAGAYPAAEVNKWTILAQYLDTIWPGRQDAARLFAGVQPYLFFELHTLLLQYQRPLGTAYRTAVNGLFGTASASAVQAQAMGLYRRLGGWASAAATVRDWHEGNIAPTLPSPGDGVAIRNDVNLALAAFITYRNNLRALTSTLTATAPAPEQVPAGPAPVAARYLDDNGAEHIFPPNPAANTEYLPAVYGDRFAAVMRIAELDATRRMTLGKASITVADPDAAVLALDKGSLITCDLGLPNNVTQYRVDGIRRRQQGDAVTMTLDCLAMPTGGAAPPVGMVTEYAPLQVTQWQVAATRDGPPLSPIGASLTRADTDTPLAYAKMPDGRKLVVRANKPDSDLVAQNQRSGEDYLYSYLPGDEIAPLVGYSDGRTQQLYGALLTPAGYTGTSVVAWNAQVAGYALIGTRRGSTLYLVAAVGAWARLNTPTAVATFDAPIIAAAPVTLHSSGAVTIGAWQAAIITPAQVAVRRWPNTVADLGGARAERPAIVPDPRGTTGGPHSVWLRSLYAPAGNPYLEFQFYLSGTGAPTRIGEARDTSFTSVDSVDPFRRLSPDLWKPGLPLTRSEHYHGDYIWYGISGNGELLRQSGMLPFPDKPGGTGIRRAAALATPPTPTLPDWTENAVFPDQTLWAIDATQQPWTIAVTPPQASASVTTR